MLINKNAVKQYIKSTKKVRVATEFYEDLNREVNELIETALRRSGNKKTLTQSALSGKDLSTSNK